MVRRRVRTRSEETGGSASALDGRLERGEMLGVPTDKELEEFFEKARAGGPEHMMRTIERFLEDLVAEDSDGDE